MNVAIFGGAFDPFTKAHLEIVEYLYKFDFIDEIIIEPSHNSYKNVKTDYWDRIGMILISTTELRDKVKVGLFDCKCSDLNRQAYTHETLEYYSHKYGNLYYVIGADELKAFESWKEPKKLLKKYHWIVFGRNKENVKEIIERSKLLYKYIKKFIIVPYENSISSTSVRYDLSQNIGHRDEIDEGALEYIKYHKLYGWE